MLNRLNKPQRNQRGVTVIELTIALIVLVFLALASFFTLSNLSGDSKAEASVAALEKMAQWRDTVVAKGTTADIDTFNAIAAPEDAGVATLKPVLGANFRPLPMQMALTELCASAKVPPDIKNRVAAALGQADGDGACNGVEAETGTGFLDGGYPTVANTGTTTSPFFAAL